MDNIWNNIAVDYAEAKQCLRGPKQGRIWHREEDKGMYHLWKAYFEAVQAAKKEDLLYARILMLMNDEQHSIWDYDRFHKYVALAKQAYDRAIQNEGEKPTDKEIEKVNFCYENLQYILKKTENTEEQEIEACKLIEGLEDVQDFQFHDSKPISFEHTSEKATLKLYFEGVLVTFLFEGLIDIEVQGDPTTNWIDDFYCYPAFYSKDVIQFDIDYYKILCKKIKVISVERKEIKLYINT